MSNTNNGKQDKSLSGLWRDNRSSDPGVDLASIIDSARVIAQSLVPGTDVTFSGVKTAQTDLKNIQLPAKDIGNQFPVPGDVVDRLLGATVHEVGHQLFSGNKMEYIERMSHVAGITDAYGHCVSSKLSKFMVDVISVFEDAYVDHLMTAYPGYHDYLKRERDACLADVDMNRLAAPLMVKCDRHDMLNAICVISLMGAKIPDSITDENLDMIGKLLDIVSSMFTKRGKDSAVVSAYKLLTTLPDFVDHNQDGLMDKINQGKKPDTEPEDAPPQDNGEQQKSGESGGDNGKESDSDSEDDGDTDKSGDEPGDNDTDSDSDDGDTDSNEPSNDSDDGDNDNDEETDKSESETDSGEGEESGEVGENEGGNEGGDGGTESEQGQPEDGDKEPGEQEQPEQWNPVNLAERLDDTVDDKTKLSDTLAKDVSDAIIEKRSDLSQLVSHIAKDSKSTILTYTPTEGAGNVTGARMHTADAEEKLRRILQEYRDKHTSNYRGLLSGRVSSRRLYRTAYGDQRVFQRRERPDEIDMIVCLLMDLSGSMHASRSLVEQVICAITDAFTKEKLEFIALGYSNNKGDVYVPRLYDKETGKINLGLEREWGSTPSYEGLAVAIAQLLRLGGNKKKILFHFTDGAPNSNHTSEITDLIKDAKERGIVCITVGIATSEQLIRIVYGGDSFVISNISELPGIIDTELRRKLETM
jgi:hypothetical protein